MNTSKTQTSNLLAATAHGPASTRPSTNTANMLWTACVNKLEEENRVSWGWVSAAHRRDRKQPESSRDSFFSLTQHKDFKSTRWCLVISRFMTSWCFQALRQQGVELRRSPGSGTRSRSSFKFSSRRGLLEVHVNTLLDVDWLNLHSGCSYKSSPPLCSHFKASLTLGHDLVSDWASAYLKMYLRCKSW